MRYKLLRRIQDGAYNCGYQLVSETNNIVFASRAKVIALAKAGSLVGVKYNKSNNSLTSIDSSINLRELRVINLQDIYNKLNSIVNTKNDTAGTPQVIQSSKSTATSNDNKRNSYSSVSRDAIKGGWVDRRMTKVEQAKEYLKVDDKSLELITDGDDYVLLRAIRSLGPNNRVIIPEFVTSISHLAFGTSAFGVDNATIVFRGMAKDCGTISLNGIFKDCYANNLEIIIEDSDRISSMYEMLEFNHQIKSVRMMFLNGMFKNLDTRDSRYGAFDCMFSDCDKLERVEIGSGSNIEDLRIYDSLEGIAIRGLFRNCGKLKYVNLKGFESVFNRTQWLIELFTDCKSIEYIDLSCLKGRRLWQLKDCFTYCDSLRAIDLSGLPIDTEISCKGTFYKSLNLESVNVKNASVAAEVMRFNETDLKDYTNKIRNTIKLSNGVSMSLKEAERLGKEMEERMEYYDKKARLRGTLSLLWDGVEIEEPDPFEALVGAEVERKRRGMV